MLSCNYTKRDTTDQRSRRQSQELEGLAYWIAERSCTLERCPDDADDLRRADDAIRLHFELLDRLGVPFWVQNAAIARASDWRNTRRQSIRSAMAARNIAMQ